MSENGNIQIQPLLLRARDAAEVLGVSQSLFAQLDNMGHVPQALRIGEKRKVWRYLELVAWTNSGCPKREKRKHDPS
jgi:predicted DNA-binding transcriptional regulator AlpA